jgi:hypothetical protein
LRGGRPHQAVRRRVAPLAVVHQQEAAGAVRDLGLPGLEAGLSEQCRLLVTRNAHHRQPRSQ